MNIAIETIYLIIFSFIQPLLVTDPIEKSDGLSNRKPEFIFVILLNYQEIALVYYDRSFQIQTCLNSSPLWHQRTGHQFFPIYLSWKYQQVVSPGSVGLSTLMYVIQVFDRFGGINDDIGATPSS